MTKVTLTQYNDLVQISETYGMDHLLDNVVVASPIELLYEQFERDLAQLEANMRTLGVL